ncbi:MAG: hypothetical protein ACLQUW_11535 [Desulfobaccales bacterium]
MVKLKVDPNVGGVGYGGKEYPIINGLVTVPEKVAQDLLSFGWGFTLSAASAPALKEVQPDMQPPPEAAPEHSSYASQYLQVAGLAKTASA